MPEKKPDKKMKLHLSYSHEDNAIVLALYEGDTALMALLDDQQAEKLQSQLDKAIVEYQKNNLLS